LALKPIKTFTIGAITISTMISQRYPARIFLHTFRTVGATAVRCRILMRTLAEQSRSL
jgi:hypothetical protein